MLERSLMMLASQLTSVPCNNGQPGEAIEQLLPGLASLHRKLMKRIQRQISAPRLHKICGTSQVCAALPRSRRETLLSATPPSTESAGLIPLRGAKRTEVGGEAARGPSRYFSI